MLFLTSSWQTATSHTRDTCSGQYCRPDTGNVKKTYQELLFIVTCCEMEPEDSVQPQHPAASVENTRIMISDFELH